MAKVIWTSTALDDVDEIRSYIAQDRPIAAARMADRLISATDLLGDFPKLGRRIGPNRRELATIRPYLIRYEIENEIVWITGVRHGARRPEHR